VGVPAAANLGRERAAEIPAAYLESGGGRRGLRDTRSLSRIGLFPEVVASVPDSRGHSSLHTSDPVLLLVVESSSDFADATTEVTAEERS